MYFITLILVDFVILAVAIILSVLLRFGTLNTSAVPLSAMALTWVFFAILQMLFSMVENLYAIRTTVNRMMNTYRTLRLILISASAYIIIQFLTHFPVRIFVSSRIAILLFLLFWTILSVLCRIILVPWFFTNLLRLTRFVTISTVIFGPSETGLRIMRALSRSPINRQILKIRIHRGEVADDPDARFDQIRAVMKETGAAEFVMIFDDEDFSFIARFSMHARRAGIPFSIFSWRIPELGYFDPWLSFKNFGALTFYSKEWSRTAEGVWRAMDIILSSIGILIFSPLMLIIALAVKLTSPGGVLFEQSRIGLNLKPFKFLKFRSMRNDANQKRQEHEAYFRKYVEGAAAEGEGAEKVFKQVDTTAVTPIGRFIRKTSLDELPQMFSVLKGEMSTVGPRPCIDYELQYYDKDWLRQRFNVKPGLTGIWQVYARSRLDFEKAQFLDFVYVMSRSDGVNIRLILKTFPVMLFGRGGI